MKSSIVLKLISWVVAIIGIVAFVLGPNSGDDKNKDMMVDYGLIILVITAVIAIVLSLINILKRPAVLKRVFLSLAILAVVLVVAYLASTGGEVLNSKGVAFKITESTSRWVGTGILYSLILLGVGALLFLVDMIKNIVK